MDFKCDELILGKTDADSRALTNEDASRIAMEDAVENMALFRRFVLNIVKQSDCGAPSQRNKLKKASWDDNYRAQLFFG